MCGKNKWQNEIKTKNKEEKKVQSIAYTRLNVRNSTQRQQTAIIYKTTTLLSYHRMQHKVVKHLTQLIHAILLEAHKTLQTWCLLTSTIHAVHHVALLLLTDEQDVEHLDLQAHMQKL